MSRYNTYSLPQTPHVHMSIFASRINYTSHTGCPGGNVPDLGRLFLKLKYTDLTQNTYIRTLFYYQLMHITLKKAELLKHSKLDKNAPTCFCLHRNHLQEAKVSAWLKITRLVNSICLKDVQGVVSAMAAYCDL